MNARLIICFAVVVLLSGCDDQSNDMLESLNETALATAHTDNDFFNEGNDILYTPDPAVVKSSISPQE